GTGLMSVPFQSGTWPNGWAISSGESCMSGAVTVSWTISGKYPPAISEKRLASRLNVSQSERASQGGVIAALNGCTKGCMSVELRSSFSYHVAVGSTISE